MMSLTQMENDLHSYRCIDFEDVTEKYYVWVVDAHPYYSSETNILYDIRVQPRDSKFFLSHVLLVDTFDEIMECLTIIDEHYYILMTNGTVYRKLCNSGVRNDFEVVDFWPVKTKDIYTDPYKAEVKRFYHNNRFTIIYEDGRVYTLERDRNRCARYIRDMYILHGEGGCFKYTPYPFYKPKLSDYKFYTKEHQDKIKTLMLLHHTNECDLAILPREVLHNVISWMYPDA